MRLKRTSTERVDRKVKRLPMSWNNPVTVNTATEKSINRRRGRASTSTAANWVYGGELRLWRRTGYTMANQSVERNLQLNTQRRSSATTRLPFKVDRPRLRRGAIYGCARGLDEQLQSAWILILGGRKQRLLQTLIGSRNTCHTV